MTFIWRGMLALFVSALIATRADAHVRVSPAEAKPGAATTYMVSIPTEGKVATIRTEFILPAGVTLVSVDPEGAPFETKTAADGATVIVFQTEIPPGWAKMFHFTATNPKGLSEIVWKAHQYFADGTAADWVDAPGSKRPASVTRLHD